MAITITPVASTEKIYMKEDPRPLSGPVILFTGDVCHLSLAVKSDRWYQYGSLRLAGGPAARALKAQRIGFVPAIFDLPPDADDYYESRPEKVYPDVLEEVDLRRINCQAGYNQGFFLTLCDSDKIPLGDSKVTATFYINGEARAKTSFVIRKLAARLPKQKCIYTSWMHYDSITAQHNVRLFTRDFYKIFASYVDAAVYSGQNMLLVPIFTPAFDTEPGTERRTAQLLDIREDAEGNFHFDFTAMHKFIAFAREHGIEYLEMPPLFSQWGAKHTPKIMVRGTDGRLRRRFGWETDALSDEYRRFLTSLLPALVAELRKVGMEENTFFHVSDEPHIDHLAHYTACKALVMPLLGDKCKTLDAYSDLAYAGNSPREYGVCAENTVHKYIEAGIRPLCTYFCCSQRMGYMPNRFLAMPLQRLLVLGALLYKYDMDLFLQWGFNFYNSFLSRREMSPYGNTDCDIHYPAGDAFIVYPDTPGGGCRTSIRLVATREMFRLSRILYLLEEKLGREAVLAILEEEGIVDFGTYPRENGWMEGFLYRLCERLA